MAKNRNRAAISAALKATTAAATPVVPSSPLAPVADGTIVFVDPEGAEISKPRDVVDVYKDFYQDAFNAPLTAPMDKVFDALRQVPGDERADTDGSIRKARLATLQQLEVRQNDPTLFDPPSAQSPMGVIASKYGDMVGSDDEANHILEHCADSAETLRGSPILFAYAVARKWNARISNDGYIEAMNIGKEGKEVPVYKAWPVPGTTDKDKPAGYKADKYKIGDRKHHFVGDIVSSFKVGKELKERINDLTNLGKEYFDPSKLKFKEYEAEYHGDEVARVAELDRLNGRWSQMIGCANTAIAFIQVSCWLKAEFPSITWGWPVSSFNANNAKDIEKVSKLRKPIQLKAVNDGSSRTDKVLKPWSMGQFIGLQLPSKKHGGKIKLNVAKQAGGTLAALLKTLERTKGKDGANNQGGDQGKSGKRAPIPSVNEIHGLMAGLANGFDDAYDPDLATAYRNKVQLWLGATGTEADDRLLMVDNVISELTILMAPHRDRVARIRSDKRKAEEDAAKLDKAARDQKLAATG